MKKKVVRQNNIIQILIKTKIIYKIIRNVKPHSNLVIIISHILLI